MEYPYLGFINEDNTHTVNAHSIIVFFTSENKGVVVHNINENNQNGSFAFGKYGDFVEDDFEFYPEENTVILQN